MRQSKQRLSEIDSLKPGCIGWLAFLWEKGMETKFNREFSVPILSLLWSIPVTMLDHLNLLGFVLSLEYIRGISEWFRRSLTHLREIWPLLTCQLKRNRFRSYDQVLYGQTGFDKTCNGLETKFDLVFTTRLFMMFSFNRNLSYKNFLRNKSNVFFQFYYIKLKSIWKYKKLLLIV